MAAGVGGEGGAYERLSDADGAASPRLVLPPAASAPVALRTVTRVALAVLAAVMLAVGVLVAAPSSPAASSSPRGSDWDDSWRAMPQVTGADVRAAAEAAVVSGADRLIYFGLGDWGRCGSPGTANPVTRVRRCNEQRSLVPTMEAYAEELNPSFMLSVGDQFCAWMGGLCCWGAPAPPLRLVTTLFRAPTVAPRRSSPIPIVTPHRAPPCR